MAQKDLEVKQKKAYRSLGYKHARQYINRCVICLAMVDEYLKPPQVSEILGVTIHTLQIWRQTERFPELKFIKLGKLVRYRRSTVERFMEKREK